MTEAALEEDQPTTTTTTKTDDKAIIAGLAVVLAVVVVANIAFVVWMWRRGWMLPCVRGLQFYASLFIFVHVAGKIHSVIDEI